MEDRGKVGNEDVDDAVLLARAVVVQAVVDALETSGYGCVNNRSQSDVLEARHFCTAPSGPWAKAREAWCDTAGIDAGKLRRLVELNRGVENLNDLVIPGCDAEFA